MMRMMSTIRMMRKTTHQYGHIFDSSAASRIAHKLSVRAVSVTMSSSYLHHNITAVGGAFRVT